MDQIKFELDHMLDSGYIVFGSSHFVFWSIQIRINWIGLIYGAWSEVEVIFLKKMVWGIVLESGLFRILVSFGF